MAQSTISGTSLEHLHVVVLAGGSGVRFWPLSRQALPKQFLSFFGTRSLLAQTVDRLAGLGSADRSWVMTNVRHVERTRSQLPELPSDQIIGEPMARDTAPCLAVAATLLAARDPEAKMLVLPADHLIQPIEDFQKAIRAASSLVDAHPDFLVTLGIRPTEPATGYGYLERGERLGEFDGVGVHRLASFREKPNLQTAQEFLASGRYFWNAGIFFWRAQTLVEQFEKHEPDMAAAARRVADAGNTPDRDKVFAEQFAGMRKVSIDYAIMEKAPHVAMIEAPFSWDDVGSWLALERTAPNQGADNVVQGQHVGLETKNCVIVADQGKFVGTIGVEDLIIVASGDAVLVAHRDQEQAVKQLLQKMEAEGHNEHV